MIYLFLRKINNWETISGYSKEVCEEKADLRYNFGEFEWMVNEKSYLLENYWIRIINNNNKEED